MATVTTALTVIPISVAPTLDVVDGQTTPIGVRLELRGVAAVSTTAACRVTRGSAYVDLTPTYSTAGEVTAVITDGNLTSLGASSSDLTPLIAWWSGTVTDGATTQTWAYQMPMVVVDRAFRFPLRYSDILIRLPVLTRSQSIPAGQTSHWPAIEKFLEDFAYDLNDKGGEVKTWLLKHPAQLKILLENEVCYKLAMTLSGYSPEQSSSLAAQAKAFRQTADRLWAQTMATVATAGSALHTAGQSTTGGIQVLAPPADRTVYTGRGGVC